MLAYAPVPVARQQAVPGRLLARAAAGRRRTRDLGGARRARLAAVGINKSRAHLSRPAGIRGDHRPAQPQCRGGNGRDRHRQPARPSSLRTPTVPSTRADSWSRRYPAPHHRCRAARSLTRAVCGQCQMTTGVVRTRPTPTSSPRQRRRIVAGTNAQTAQATPPAPANITGVKAFVPANVR